MWEIADIVTTFLHQHPNSGGGSGGAVWIKATEFKGRGFIYTNGGAGKTYGGGGAGGRINVFFKYGDFKSDHVYAKGLWLKC